jgi:hypothetical protein
MTIRISKKILSLIVLTLIILTGLAITFTQVSGRDIIGKGLTYKVEFGKTTYYPVAYGIKNNGDLRIEVNVSPNPTGAKEINKDYKEVLDTKILELPAGKWKLYDLVTNKQIK